MQKILITLDYTPSAQKVAELGYALGKALKAEIVLIHIIEEAGYYSTAAFDPIMGYGGFSNINFLNADVMNSIQKEASLFLEKTKLHLQDKKIKTLVLQGNIADTILEIIKKEKYNMVVIGTHNHNEIENLILGSTAHKLIKHSTIPLYLIPTNKTK